MAGQRVTPEEIAQDLSDYRAQKTSEAAQQLQADAIRRRDALWCLALIQASTPGYKTDELQHVEAVLRRFNELRDERGQQ